MKEQFPIFENNPDLVFLDSAASAQKPECVIEAMTDVMESSYANIHRGLYNLSQHITVEYEKAREKVAKFINADSTEVVFTRNATESINLVAQSWGKANLKKGDEVIISILEHHANIVPWQMLEKEIGIKLVVIPCSADGSLNFEAFKKLITNKTKFLSITAMSNSLGVCIDTKKFIKEAKKHGITTLIDGCQSIVHAKQNMQELDCDFFVFSGHKLYGPTGIGILYGKKDILNNMPPYQTGGDMIKTVSIKEGPTFEVAPARFEAGTPAIVEAIGLGAAIDFVEGLNRNEIEAKEKEITQQTLAVLNSIEGIKVIGKNQRGIISFTTDWGTPEDIATLLNQQNIAVRVGNHCNMPLMDELGFATGTIRVSLAVYNDDKDITKLEKALLKCKDLL